MIRNLIVDLLSEKNDSLAVQTIVDIHPVGLGGARNSIRDLGD